MSKERHTFFYKTKKIIAVILIMTLCGNNFAATVNSSDGGIFVTKEEFEEMKEDFDSQVISYQNSLDNKVDGAIASYLAGLAQKNREDIKSFIKITEDVWKKKILWSSTPSVVEDHMTNYSEFLLTVVNSLGTYNRCGLYTLGYGPSTSMYQNGYNVLKLNKGKINSNIKYSPMLTYVVIYADLDSTTDNTTDLSCWSGITNFNGKQTDTATKYWVGYKNNDQKIATSKTSGAQHVSVYYTATEKYDDFVIAPLATNLCSLWDPTNEDASATGDGTLNQYPVYRSSITGGTNSSTPVQSVYSYPLCTCDWNINLPWVSQDHIYNEQILDFNGLSPKPVAMKYGLPIVESDRAAEIHFTVNAKKGRIGWYLNNPVTYDNIPEKQKKTIDKDMEIKGSIEVEPGDILFFIYLPDETAALDFKELFYSAL